MLLSLRAAREIKKCSIAELCRRAHRVPRTVYRLERNLTMPDYDTVVAFEKALGLRHGTLVFAPRRRRQRPVVVPITRRTKRRRRR